MSNHVHLLLTPGEGGLVAVDAYVFAQLRRVVSNGRHWRAGTLW
jgi:hypothetical protein